MIATFVLLFVLASPRSTPVLSEIVTMSGYAGVRVGMTLAQAESASHGGLTHKDQVRGDCFFVLLDSDPCVSFMIESGRVVRVDVSTPGIRTLSGAQVGDSERRIRALFGTKLRSEVHAYDPNGRYLIVESADRHSAVIFETDGNVVTDIHAGVYPAVGYIEGCL